MCSLFLIPNREIYEFEISAKIFRNKRLINKYEYTEKYSLWVHLFLLPITLFDDDVEQTKIANEIKQNLVRRLLVSMRRDGII